MARTTSDIEMTSGLMFRLLPAQVLLAMVGAINGLVSSYFASNYVGVEAMGAVGLYAPLNLLVTSFGAVIIGGSSILCGRHLGEDHAERTQNVFSLAVAASALVALLFTALFLGMGVFDLSAPLSRDASVRPIFNTYLIGQALGIIPLMLVFVVGLIACARPLAAIFFTASLGPVFDMTAWGFRLLPLCMPLSIICMHFTCYGQVSNKQGLVHLLALLDGVVCVAAFSVVLAPTIGIIGVYVANIFNGVVTTIVIFAYALLKNRRLPRNMDELLVIPEDFGAPESDRLDVSVKDIEGVALMSDKVQAFCRERGMSERVAYFSALALEEMAGNVVSHGFTKDSRRHSVDIRVVHKGETIILRIKDGCVPFDPSERLSRADPEDRLKNAGICLVFRMAEDVQYQNVLGMNVLTIRMGA